MFWSTFCWDSWSIPVQCSYLTKFLRDWTFQITSYPTRLLWGITFKHFPDTILGDKVISEARGPLSLLNIGDKEPSSLLRLKSFGYNHWIREIIAIAYISSSQTTTLEFNGHLVYNLCFSHVWIIINRSNNEYNINRQHFHHLHLILFIFTIFI